MSIITDGYRRRRKYNYSVQRNPNQAPGAVLGAFFVAEQIELLLLKNSGRITFS
jgi:hypothetical protein